MGKPSVFANIECVTLDLDDTLWPVTPTLKKAEQLLYDWIDEHYPKITNEYTLKELTAKRSLLASEKPDLMHNVTKLRHYSLYGLAEEFAYDAGKFADNAMSLFRYYRNLVEPFQDSEDVLKSLKQNYTLGAITNGNAQLHNIPIGQHFDFIVTAEEVGVRKPDAQMFLHASKCAQTEIENIVHVGDCPQSDVLGALNAGCKAIWFNNKRQVWPGGQTPDYVVNILSELPDVLMTNKK